MEERQDLPTPLQQTNEVTLTTSKHTFELTYSGLPATENLTEVNLQMLIADGGR